MKSWILGIPKLLYNSLKKAERASSNKDGEGKEEEKDYLTSRFNLEQAVHYTDILKEWSGPSETEKLERRIEALDTVINPTEALRPQSNNFYNFFRKFC